MVDLHRHSDFSTFDGFGSAIDCAAQAKELGYTSLGLTDHGTTSGLVKHYKACKDHGIKPILGVEAYFLPTWKEQTRGDHLCIFAKNKEGYGNINRLMWRGDAHKYYNPIITFKDLAEFHEGLIISSACVSGTLAKLILAGEEGKAIKFLRNMKKIFGGDFYVEVQPYVIDTEGTQEKVNRAAMDLALRMGIKCIPTSDSHRPRKDDLPSYLKMHEIAKHDMQHIEETYRERYMPDVVQLRGKYLKMHGTDGLCSWRDLYDALSEIEDKIDGDILDQLSLVLPRYSDDVESPELLKKKVIAGLKAKGKYQDRRYVDRCKEELKIINHHGLADYFLMVADYVNHAKDNGVAVGPGRGSGCNSEINYMLGITDVDSLYFNLDFRRFLRMDKLKFPDIDVDFETDRRDGEIEYLIKKYRRDDKMMSARICSYGLYKVDNLINDLAKVCGLPIDKEVDDSEAKLNKGAINSIKKLCKQYVDDDGKLDRDGLLSDPDAISINRMYDDIILHFCKLFCKVRYIGTHAAGVAITGGDLLDYVALRTDKSGEIYTVYDLEDVESIGVIKFDLLGLSTMSGLGECQRISGDSLDDVYEWIHDPKIMQAFREGNTDGIFQFGKKSVKQILGDIKCDNFEDIIAANSMNRPVPLKLGVPDQYAENKSNIEKAQEKVWYPYTKDTYGTVIYQEHLINLCVELAGMEWPDVDKLMKIIKKPINEKTRPVADALKEKFVDGMHRNHGTDRDEAGELFEGFLAYLFNKGHATGYSMISVEEMYYKLYHPAVFWYVKIKYAKTDEDYAKFCERAVCDGVVVFLPHVNYSGVRSRLRKVDGEYVIQQGLSDIKGLGEKAAQHILDDRKENGIFRDVDDLIDRVQGHECNRKVMRLLEETGAAQFKKPLYIKAVKQYNAALYGRGCMR